LLQLLIVPLALAVIGFWFTAQQDARQQQIENKRAEAERNIEEQRAQDAALQAYLDQMNTLFLEENLSDAKVRTLLRARTLTVLERLDPSRKAQVMRFLVEAKLVQRVGERPPLIGLSGANLSGTTMFAFDLSGADLNGANLSNVILPNTNLRDANLLTANLSGADLSGADLSGANLPGADLSDANLEVTDLSDAILSDADLHGADLSDANLLTVTLANRKRFSRPKTPRIGYRGSRDTRTWTPPSRSR
jgi:uncharacterized protein YjbI with pentapeptide repeats